MKATTLTSARTSTSTVDLVAFMGRRGEGSGVGITTDFKVVELVNRDGAWRVVRHVSPESIPVKVRTELNAQNRPFETSPARGWTIAWEEWMVRERGHVFVIRAGGRLTSKFDSGIPDKPYYTDRNAVVRRAASLNGAAKRVLLVPKDQVKEADVSGDFHVVDHG